MHKEASRRKFDIVIAWSVDRLGRSLQDLIGFLSASALTSPCRSRASKPRHPKGELRLPFSSVRSRPPRLKPRKSRATPQLSPITGTVFGEPTTERCQRSPPRQEERPCPSQIMPENIRCCACAWRRSAATWLQRLPHRSCERESCGWPTGGRNSRISPLLRSHQTATKPTRSKISTERSRRIQRRAAGAQRIAGCASARLTPRGAFFSMWSILTIPIGFPPLESA